MPSLFTDVLPGDLITAELMNRLLHELEELEIRVTALETGAPSTGAVQILSVSPAGPIRIGQEVHVLGKNFGYLLGASRVLVDSVLVTAFKSGSSDQELIFTLPDLPGVPLAGRQALLSVGNRSSVDQVPITVLPAQPLQGGVDVTFLDVAPGTLVPNQPATFRFKVRSRANLDASFTITPLITVAANSATWNGALQVLDSGQNVIADRTLPVPASQERIFFVRINPVPVGTNNVPFQLTVTAAAGTVSGSSSPLDVTVGVPVPIPEPSITLTFASADFNPPGSGSVVQGTDGYTLRVQAGGQAKITLNAEFTAADTFNVPNPTFLVSTANWTGQRFAQSTPPNYQITPAQLAAGNGKRVEGPEWLVTPVTGASGTGTVEFRIERPSTTTVRTLRMKLLLI